MIIMTSKVLRCRLCKYEWEARKAQPKTCPRCKRYDWDVNDFGLRDREIVKKGEVDKDFDFGA